MEVKSVTATLTTWLYGGKVMMITRKKKMIMMMKMEIINKKSYYDVLNLLYVKYNKQLHFNDRMSLQNLQAVW